MYITRYIYHHMLMNASLFVVTCIIIIFQNYNFYKLILAYRSFYYFAISDEFN